MQPLTSPPPIPAPGTPVPGHAGTGGGTTPPAARRKPRPRPYRWWARPEAVTWAGLALGALALLPHLGSWVGHNGDHYYYASTALQYAGVPYDESLRTAAGYFGYPYPASQLDLGYLNPAVAPLIYPRVVLGLLALPFVAVAGIAGIWVPGLLCGAASLVVLQRFALSRLGRTAALVLPGLALVTTYATEFMFGIYQEAPLVLLVSVLLLLLPVGRHRRGWPAAVAAAALVPLMMLCRQVPLLPTGMVLGGWLWATLARRSPRNRWTPVVLTVLPTTVASYLLLQRWAPYDALPYLYERTGTSDLAGLVSALPGMWSTTLSTDTAQLLSDDPATVVVAALAVLGLVVAARSPFAGVAVGALLSGWATELLNGQPNGYRYLAPALPVVLPLAALAVAVVVRLLVRRRWTRPVLVRPEPARPVGASEPPRPLPPVALELLAEITGDPADLPVRASGARRAGPWRRGRARRSSGRTVGGPPVPLPVVGAVLAWALVVVTLAGAVATHRAAPVTASQQVRSADAPDSWPFAEVSAGTLECGDGLQIWFVTDDGRRLALSGTAMAADPLGGSVLDLAPDRLVYGWPALTPLLDAGMQLCGAGRGYRTGGDGVAGDAAGDGSSPDAG